MKRKASYVDVIDLGQVPPSAVDIESKVIGCCLVYPESYIKVAHILTPETFYKSEHQEIFTSIANVYKEKDTCDQVLVVNELERREKLSEIGGPLYIAQLSSSVVSDTNIEYWAKTILEKYVLREQVRLGMEQVREAFDPNTDATAVIQSAARNADRLSTVWITRTSPSKGANAVSECIDDLAKRCKNFDSGTLNGIPTGLSDLDKITNGWQNSDLIILAGRPAQGKTSYALHAAVAAAKAGFPAKVYSLEMSRLQLMYKLLATESGVDPNNIRRGCLTNQEWDRINVSVNRIKEWPLIIDDTPGVSPEYIYATTKLDASKGKCSVVFIDYLGLISYSEKGKSTADNVGYVTRRMKALAKVANIPVILLSQLSREVEKRPNKKPALADLRDSGEIEANADMAVFVYRPEQYGLTDSHGDPIIGRGSLLIEKHRNGPCGDVKFRYNQWMSQLWDDDKGENYEG